MKRFVERRPPLLSALMAGLLLAAPAGAAMYKWVDAQGNTHYGELPPPEVRAERIRPPPPPPPPHAEEATTPEREETPSPGEAAATEGSDPAAEQERREIFRRNCAAARENLTLYTQHRRIKNQKGEVVVFSEAERAAKIKETEAHIEKYCIE